MTSSVDERDGGRRTRAHGHLSTGADDKPSTERADLALGLSPVVSECVLETSPGRLGRPGDPGDWREDTRHGTSSPSESPAPQAEDDAIRPDALPRTRSGVIHRRRLINRSAHRRRCRDYDIIKFCTRLTPINRSNSRRSTDPTNTNRPVPVVCSPTGVLAELKLCVRQGLEVNFHRHDESNAELASNWCVGGAS
ncbi:hypothetical protein DPEC_G00344720 [Dallia pectoralis]|uniref:Uncharacterized protein n=1 Tax=Dallia pectoralis TaxID=75939 RepID=A0ACC2F3G3_DALPE|nr:hypothetical protein DPEC_G00344720 [Dallia pectoralis]